MLKFPLPPVPNPSLPIRSLNYATYQQLCAVMDHEGRSSFLLKFILKNLNQENVAANIPPHYSSAQLFTDLERWNCYTVEILASLLEQCGLHEPLYLLKEQIPLEILEQPPPEIVAKLHQRVKLSFTVTGFPKPMFQWYLNNSKMESATENTLVIADFRYSDIGSYTCEIVQQCRNGLFQTVFTVASIVSLEPFAPDIKKNPQDCQLKPGDFVEMRCIIEGYPIPDFQWYKDDQPLANKTMPILKFGFVTHDDSGRYWCLATNSEGKARTKEAIVEVVPQNPPYYPPPVNITGPSQKLNCFSYGAEPNPWFTDGERMISQTADAMIDLLMHQRNASLTCSQQVHTASTKQALLIGNWTYDTHKLEKVRADIKTLHDILDKMEFETIALCNLGKMEILNAADRFCELLLPDAYAVVYFAGHGIHHYTDYLMPVDLPIDSDYSAKDLVDVNEIIAKIQMRFPKLLFVLLDMCRTFPNKSKNPRIKEEMPKEVPRDSRSNLVMVWATSEDSSAYEMSNEENGIFMTYLKKALDKRNITVIDMLERFKRYSKREIPSIASDQMPVMFSSLAEALSLYDPVDRENIGEPSWNNCLELAKIWKELPEEQICSVTVNNNVVVFHVRFALMDDCFSNGLAVILTIQGNERVTFKPLVHPPTLELSDFSQDWAKGKCTITITIHKLQTLTEDATFFLEVVESPGKIIKVPLGQPLIAKAHLVINTL